MKKEYDFSRGKRGKFYSPEVRLNLPIYLDADNLSAVEKIAERKNLDITTVVNELLRSDREIAKMLE